MDWRSRGGWAWRKTCWRRPSGACPTRSGRRTACSRRSRREGARAYLLEARKTVEAALGQARAAVTEATAREARRMVEEAIEKTAGSADRRLGGSKDLAVGDRVRTAQGKVGTITEIRSDGR